ncbi:MAG: hypothetical protein ABIA75_01780 [Candidatus Neomarinimicrobiota bacterium]
MTKNFEYLISAENNPKDRIWCIQPVGAITFIEQFIGTMTLSDPQKEVIGSIFGDDPTNQFFQVEQAILRIGQGGGKNFLITRCVVYFIYLWCCLENPHRYFNLAENEHFDILNFSQVSAQQAKNVFFKSLVSILKLTKDPLSGKNWFESKAGFKIKAYGRGDIKDKELIIPNRRPGLGNIRVFCLDMTAKSVEGYTIWVSIMDEPSRANTRAKYTVAKHQYQTAYSNQKTRFTNPHHRCTIVFAYPEQEYFDLLIELYNTYAKNPRENSWEMEANILTAWYDTFVFNAKDQADKKLAYEMAYRHDPIDADRRWKAIVPPSIDSFFTPYENKIVECANPDLVNPIKYRETITRRVEKVNGRDQYCSYTALEPLEIQGDHRERFWGGDFAIKKDRLVIVGGYATRSLLEINKFTDMSRTPSGVEEVKEQLINCRPIIDTILIWEVKPGGYAIDYSNVDYFLTELIKHHFSGTRAIHFDKFNTESTRQKILDRVTKDCESLSFTNAQQVSYGRLVRYLVINNAIEYLDNDLLQQEMKQLIFENQTKLDHPPGGSKDVWDAFSICVNLIITKNRWSSEPRVDIGESDESDAIEDNYDERMRIFNLAFKNFVNTHGRQPRDDEELREWLFKSYSTKFTLQEVQYFKQHRSEWESSGRGKMAMLGLTSPSRRTGCELDYFSVDDPWSF